MSSFNAKLNKLEKIEKRRSLSGEKVFANSFGFISGINLAILSFCSFFIIALSLFLSLSQLSQLDAQAIFVPRNPYSPARNLQLGDVIKVQVYDSITADYEYEMKRQDSLTIRNTPDANIGKFLPSMDSSQDTTRKKIGHRDAGHKIRGSLSVLVIEKNEDGTYALAGSKTIHLDGQKSSLQLSGVVHPRSITPSYTVASDQIANLIINIQGEIVAKRKPLQRLLAPGEGQENQDEEDGETDSEENDTINEQTQRTDGSYHINPEDRRQILQQYVEKIYGEILDQDE